MTARTSVASLDFARLHNRLVIDATLTTITGLRIGSGTGQSLTAADISVVKDALGRPYIPGSSFKGVLRSIVEQFVRTMESGKGQGRGACNPLDEQGRCITRDQMKQWRNADRDDPEQVTQKVLDHSCRVCRVFGSPWLASRVLVKDLSLTGGWFGRFDVRDGVGIDRDTGAAATGILYSYEAVPPGVSFGLTVIIENAQPHEQGLVLWGLHEFKMERARLGGACSRGLGWVKLENLTATYIDGSDRQSLLSYLSGGQVTPLQETVQMDRIKALIEHLNQGEGRESHA